MSRFKIELLFDYLFYASLVQNLVLCINFLMDTNKLSDFVFFNVSSLFYSLTFRTATGSGRSIPNSRSSQFYQVGDIINLVSEQKVLVSLGTISSLSRLLS